MANKAQKGKRDEEPEPPEDWQEEEPGNFQGPLAEVDEESEDEDDLD